MKDEFLKFFNGLEITTFFDGTLGAGGHAEALLEAHPEIETYIGCDRDEESLGLARENLKKWGRRVEFVHANFADLDEVLEERNIKNINGFFLI
jgi:16S rRNA (cytosine1402-N4)-methyltransferase